MIPFIGFRISDIVFPPGIKELEEEILIVWIAIPLSTDCFYALNPAFLQYTAYAFSALPYTLSPFFRRLGTS
ncbi:MAG: hypothetical protein WBI82_10800 [Sphaerochaeta sp.]